MSDKVRYPREDAIAVAKELCDLFKPITVKLCVAGSLRRRKSTVGDVEILYVPSVGVGAPHDLFAPPPSVSLVDILLADLITKGVLAKRINAKGCEMWGDFNKLAVHKASGIPVDLFRATMENWPNYLVCRTGPGASNIAIAAAAKRRGWTWNPYGTGFSRVAGLAVETHQVHSERDVFEFVGLPYREPWDR